MIFHVFSLLPTLGHLSEVISGFQSEASLNEVRVMRAARAYGIHSPRKKACKANFNFAWAKMVGKSQMNPNDSPATSPTIPDFPSYPLVNVYITMG